MEKAILVDRSPAGDTTDTAMEGTSEGAPGNPAALEVRCCVVSSGACEECQAGINVGLCHTTPLL